MKPYRKIIIVVVGLIFLTISYGWCYTESYCFFLPSIDTKFAEGYSEEKFQNIHNGMTIEKVILLLGSPLETITNKDSKVATLYYSQDGAAPFGDFAWLGRVVLIKNGLVLDKGATVYYD